jgi:hypothetical protein
VKTPKEIAADLIDEIEHYQDPDYGGGEAMSLLEHELKKLLNAHSAENASDTPDFILARYVTDCLDSYARATKERDRWRSPTSTPVFHPEPPPADAGPSVVTCEDVGCPCVSTRDMPR